MLASLPMYDLPEVRDATNTIWSNIRARLHARIPGLPLELDRTKTREAQWRHAGLILSQTCGYPLRFHFREHLRVIGAPRYSAPGCDGHDYSSELVVRNRGRVHLGEFRGSVLAVNGIDSQSGYNAVKATLHTAGFENSTHQPFFGQMKVSGTHRASIGLVQRGEADIAAIDAVSLALIRTHAPGELEDLHVIHHSPAAPSLPCVTSARTSDTTVIELRNAIKAMLTDPALAFARNVLQLVRLDNVGMREYERIDTMTLESGNLVLAPEDLASQ